MSVSLGMYTSCLAYIEKDRRYGVDKRDRTCFTRNALLMLSLLSSVARRLLPALFITTTLFFRLSFSAPPLELRLTGDQAQTPLSRSRYQRKSKQKASFLGLI